MDDVGFGLLIAAVAGVLIVGSCALGQTYQADELRKDCANLHQFRSGNKAYRCEPVQPS
jgi:hypothetical protein